jgi:DNA modification methylase/DNA-binding XRE family transcriptional regulator
MQNHVFGARLLELREQAGLTLRQLASALDVDHTYLSHIEGGRRVPSDDVLQKVATYFERDLDVLRLEAGQVPDRLRSVMQRHPQLTLSLLGSLEDRRPQADRPWYTEAREILEPHVAAQLPLDVVDAYQREPFARHIDAGKNTPIYNAHSYHTKVPYQGITPYLEHYTAPGDVVLDPFAGSGMTGVAAILAGRDAVLNDLSPAAVHIARNYVTPCSPEALEEAFAELSETLASYQLLLYETTCDGCGGRALIEYSVFADIFSCTTCRTEVNLWDHGRDGDGRLIGHLTCPSCHATLDKNVLSWVRSDARVVSYSCLEGCTGGRRERSATDADVARLAEVERVSLPGWVPEKPFGPDWEMWRQGHADRAIGRVCDFFTARNLRALAAIHDWINRYSDARVRAGLLFAFTGCVNRASKRYQWNQKRPTNVLSGTLYVSSLFYEFNVFRLFERKVRAAVRLYQATWRAKGKAAVCVGSATDLREVPDASIDYVFTDPPFGSNIYYADCSLLWEAWLGEYTDKTREIVINRALKSEQGGKSLEDYRCLLTNAFREIRRVLKPARWASVVFHNSSADVWEVVRAACLDAGFTLGSAVMFDKRQKSFKGIKGIVDGESVANYDVVLNLQKKAPILTTTESEVPSEARLVEALRSILVALPPNATAERRSTPFLHSLAIQHALQERLHLHSIDLKRFELLLEREFVRKSGAWYADPITDDGSAEAQAEDAGIEQLVR